jgi:hypothetical protein
MAQELNQTLSHLRSLRRFSHCIGIGGFIADSIVSLR